MIGFLIKLAVFAVIGQVKEVASIEEAGSKTELTAAEAKKQAKRKEILQQELDKLISDSVAVLKQAKL